MSQPPRIDLTRLLNDYDGLLIDAYGVLVHSAGAFPGAEAFIDRLHAEQLPFVVITNDASRLPQSCADKYRRDGLDIRAAQVVTSGSLVVDYFRRHQLSGARCRVLGTPDSQAYVERAGGRIVDVADDFEVLIIGDEAGYDFVPVVEDTLTRLIHKVEAGGGADLVVPNPDIIYQRSEDTFGFTSGSVAHLIERAIAARFPGRNITFDRLGKPYSPMFDEAIDRVGTSNCALLGDQLATDIKGANDAGLDSVLVATGLADVQDTLGDSPIRPNYIFDSLVG